MFPISRDPPEGGTLRSPKHLPRCCGFPISRDPPEGGTGGTGGGGTGGGGTFPISRDPPEGGTLLEDRYDWHVPDVSNF